MRCVHAADVPPGQVCEIGAQGVQVQWLLGPAEGAPTFALRRFTLEPNGQTPRHSHPWEHEVYVLQGGGAVVTEQGETPVRPDCAVLVLPDEIHCFRAGAEGLQFLCLVPLGEATQGH
ncbi:cupin domain-containing protein [bacterium]|nr:cupin domain-containing protein [bacterium]